MLRRWSELLKRFEMIVEVMEQNETGEYEPVELVEKVDNVTGGVFRLKQASRIDSPSICHFPFLSFRGSHDAFGLLSMPWKILDLVRSLLTRWKRSP